jgi:hypothetical protein
MVPWILVEVYTDGGEGEEGEGGERWIIMPQSIILQLVKESLSANIKFCNFKSLSEMRRERETEGRETETPTDE